MLRLVPAFATSCFSLSDELWAGFCLGVFTSWSFDGLRRYGQYRADNRDRWQCAGDIRHAHQRRSRKRLHILRRSAQSISNEPTGVGDIHSWYAVREYYSGEWNVGVLVAGVRHVIRMRVRPCSQERQSHTGFIGFRQAATEENADLFIVGSSGLI